jgi:hypothetical protein
MTDGHAGTTRKPSEPEPESSLKSVDLLVDAFGRIQEEVHAVAGGLTVPAALRRIDEETNSIAWLLWHLTRIQDDHLSAIAGSEQVWTAQGWADRFHLPFAPAEIGYGHTSEQVAAVQVDSVDLLTGYHDAVYQWTLEFVRGLTDTDFDRVVDEQWNPPVTLGVRVISVISDALQHVGQAAILRGIGERAEK